MENNYCDVCGNELRDEDYLFNKDGGLYYCNEDCMKVWVDEHAEDILDDYCNKNIQ